MKLQNILSTLSKTSASTKKLEILTKNKTNKVLRTVMFYTYNPFYQFYMKKVPTTKVAGKDTIDKKIDALTYLLDTLRNRKVTGNAARDMVQDFLGSFNKISQDIIGRILKKDLKIGMSGKSANKVWKNLIPEFSVALAKTYEGKVDIFDGTWLTSRKLDGCRCITIIEDGDVKFFSRNGKEFNTLDVLKENLLSIVGMKRSVVLDGEICITDGKGSEDFSSVMKEIRKKGHTIKNPKYYVFDMLTVEEFFSKKSKRTLRERLDVLVQDFPLDNNVIKQLEQYIVSENSFAEMQDNVKEEGWEGLIVRKDAPYKGKRSKDLLKVKKFFDDEYKVIDIETGPFTHSVKGKGQVTEDMLTAVIIKHKGYKVSVGSGFSIEQRKEFLKDPKKIIGKTITVQYFEESKNQNGGLSLRFPTCKFIYENGRSV